MTDRSWPPARSDAVAALRTDLAAAGYSLRDVGYSSLSYMRLIDSIENEVGVYLDPEAAIEHYETIDSVTALVLASGVGADA